MPDLLSDLLAPVRWLFWPPMVATVPLLVIYLAKRYRPGMARSAGLGSQWPRGYVDLARGLSLMVGVVFAVSIPLALFDHFFTLSKLPFLPFDLDACYATVALAFYLFALEMDPRGRPKGRNPLVSLLSLAAFLFYLGIATATVTELAWGGKVAAESRRAEWSLAVPLSVWAGGVVAAVVLRQWVATRTGAKHWTAFTRSHRTMLVGAAVVLLALAVAGILVVDLVLALLWIVFLVIMYPFVLYHLEGSRSDTATGIPKIPVMKSVLQRMPRGPYQPREGGHLDFDLQVDPRADGRYPVAVLWSPAGESRVNMDLVPDAEPAANSLRALHTGLIGLGGQRDVKMAEQERTPTAVLAQTVGTILFNALFTGGVEMAFRESLQVASHENKVLRLRLRVRAPELLALPWEVMYDDRRASFLATSRETTFVRYLEVPRSPRPLKVEGPVRVLGVAALPDDLPELDIEREKSLVDEAVAPLQQSGLIHLEWLEHARWQEIQKAMRISEWHVLYFLGHGQYDRESNTGLIALVGEDGNANSLPAADFGMLLADHRPLRLVLLNACESAAGSPADVFSSTAATLAQQGIPAVIAMQYRITDEAAIQFAQALAQALADGTSIDVALAEARKAVKLARSETAEWAIPVLYLRSPDGVLFEVSKE